MFNIYYRKNKNGELFKGLEKMEYTIHKIMSHSIKNILL